MSNLKNVLCLHIDTTGLPINEKFSLNFSKKLQYPNYTENEKYEDCRLVRISWIFKNNQKDFIRKPKNIEFKNEKFHNVSLKQAKKEGISITKIFQEFINDLNNADYIVGHNVYFHLNIILNELYRKEWINIANMVNNFINDNKIICTSEIGKNFTKIKIQGKNKPPTIYELYKCLFKKDLPKFIGCCNAVVHVNKIFNKLIQSSITNNKKLIVTPEANLLSYENYENILNKTKNYTLTKYNNQSSETIIEKIYLLRISKISDSYIEFDELFNILKNYNVEILGWGLDLTDKLKLLSIVSSLDGLNINSPDFYEVELIPLSDLKSIKKGFNYIHHNCSNDKELEHILIRNLINSNDLLF